MECPEENTWLRYLGGAADDELHTHLDGCAECRVMFAELARSGLERGAQLGRYVVIDELGRGGMGIVYKAFDPELDRAIAVKLVAVGKVDDARQRLVREARTLARLSHPNVVAVHDVGTIGDDVFVAMEYVAGETLRAWLRTRRPPAEILGVLGGAARGLAAAHRLGIVHRDFKPENVMVDGDGRARVLDFGLARSAGTVDPAHAPTGSGDHRVTRTGAVAGTPQYMAPEQARAASAASDQFSFCVVLYEALYGERPVADAQAPSGVPSRVRRALERGLRSDPAARFASMDALLEAMQPPRRARVAIAVLAVLAIGGGTAAWMLARRPSVDDACALAANDANRVWNPARRAALVKLAGEPVAGTIDGWTRAWSVRRKELCAQTIESDIDRSQDIAQQVGCLRRRLASLDGSISAIVDADLPELVRDAPNAIARAGSPTVCDSYERGTLDAPTRARYMPIFAAIVTARVALDAGKIDEAEAAATKAVAAVKTRPDPEPDLLAGALGALGFVQAEREQFEAAHATLNEAIRFGTIAREDLLVAEAWSAVLLMAVRGYDKEVDAAIFGAEVAASKLPPDAPARCMILGRAAAIDAKHRRTDAGLQRAEQSLACWRASPAHGDQAAEAQFVIGLLHTQRADWIAAGTAFEAAVAHWAKVGKPHADYAMALDNLGMIALFAEDAPLAVRQFTRSLEIARDPAVIAATEGHLAYALVRAERCTEAVPVLARARAHQEAQYGARSSQAAATMVGEAVCALAANEPTRAKALLEIAKPIIDGSPAANASTIALADFTLARTLVALHGSKARARALAEHALAKLAGSPLAIHRREIETWLAAHR